MLGVEVNLLSQAVARESVAALGFRPTVVGGDENAKRRRGEEAMPCCRSTPPDRLPMDIQMPGLDGADRARLPTLARERASERGKLASGRREAVPDDQFGTASEVPENPIWVASSGAATMPGTLAVVIAGAAPAKPPRGVARTTWLAGSAVPERRCAYIASIART